MSNIRSAQKVGTDGVLTGAYAAGSNPHTIWDVGSGTGLIALMMAQRYNYAEIVAIDVDSESVAECRNNVEASPWSERISIVEGDIMAVYNQLPTPDLIVSNPPFFASTGEKSPDCRRLIARHEGTLSPDSLIKIAYGQLAPGGRLVFIAPYDRNDSITLSAELGRMAVVECLDISSRGDRRPIRRIWTLMRREESTVKSPIILQLNVRNSSEGYPYSDEYIALTSDFYLDF